MSQGKDNVRRLRALVLEDERVARNYLVELLVDSGSAEVVAAVQTSQQAFDALASNEAQLGIEVAFVDVHLAGDAVSDAGLHWIRAVSSRENAPRFVLTTASSDHAMEAYALGVTDYLLKPFTPQRVTQCLARLLATRFASTLATAEPPRRIVARDGRNLVFLPREACWAFEADARLTFVHAPEGRFDLDLTLTAVEAALHDEWLRVHRNWLVAPAWVRRMDRRDGEVTLVVGDGPRALTVPVARDRVSAVRDALFQQSVGLRRSTL